MTTHLYRFLRKQGTTPGSTVYATRACQPVPRGYVQFGASRHVDPGLAYAAWYRREHPEALALSIFTRFAEPGLTEITLESS